MCDGSEFDPSTATVARPFGLWVDAAGKAVRDTVLTATADCYGGTQVRFLQRLFVRIPGGGVDPAQLATTWSDDATLPTTAFPTEYRSGTRRLYAGADGKAVYVADGDRVERLPHVIGDEVSRMDCN
jgi:hypothetical protein